MSGQDIQRKGTTRKAKFLFSLPGSLASVKGGTIGKISGMNTGTPTMTLHFPQVSAVWCGCVQIPRRTTWRLAAQGDILLQGAVVKPATARFMTLQCSKAGIVCEDVFNAVVVFSSAVWQGKDGAATLPPELIQDALPLSTFSAGCGRPRRRATASSQETPTATQDSQVSSTSSARGGRRRRAAAVVTSLAEEDLAEEAGGGSDSDSGDDASVPDSEVEEVVVSRASLLAPGTVGGVKRQRLPASSPAPGGISDSEDSSDGVAVVVHSSSDQASQDSDATESGDGRPPPKRRAAPRRGSARAKPAHQGSEERSEAGSDSDSGDSEEASPSSQSSAFDDSDDEDFQDE